MYPCSPPSRSSINPRRRSRVPALLPSAVNGAVLVWQNPLLFAPGVVLGDGKTSLDGDSVGAVYRAEHLACYGLLLARKTGLRRRVANAAR